MKIWFNQKTQLSTASKLNMETRKWETLFEAPELSTVLQHFNMLEEDPLMDFASDTCNEDHQEDDVFDLLLEDFGEKS